MREGRVCFSLSLALVGIRMKFDSWGLGKMWRCVLQVSKSIDID